MKTFKVKLTPYAFQRFNLICDGLIPYWESQNKPDIGVKLVNTFINDIDAAIDYLSMHFLNYQIKCSYQNNACRCYPIGKSKQYVLLYTVNEQKSLVEIQSVLPSAGNELNNLIGQ